MTARHLGTVTGGRLNLRAAADTSAVVQVQIPDGTFQRYCSTNGNIGVRCPAGMPSYD